MKRRNLKLEPAGGFSHNRLSGQAGVTAGYVALGIVGFIAGVGLAYQAIGEYRDHHRYPLKGALIAVGPSKMHLYCTGQGEPAVILEAPQTGLSALWHPVQEAVSRFARVCSYDRAGFGWSEPGPQPRSSERIASELHSLLTQAGVPPPYVLVGASAGGFHVRVFADRFPAEVAGVVLVDSSHPDQVQRVHAPENPARHIEKWEPLLPLMHRFGILRIGLRQEPRPASFSEDAWDEVLYLREKANSYRAILREGEAWAESADQVRKSSDLGAKPLLVLTGSRDVDSAWLALWVNGLQTEMAHLCSKGKQVVLTNSGHGIQFDAPGAVADAIHEIREAVDADRIKN
jgi:pimeloyl-ACP methyl ester carboxylesterase